MANQNQSQSPDTQGYNFEQRKRQWEGNFSQHFKIVSDKLISEQTNHQLITDPVLIKLQNVADKVKDLQADVTGYEGKHKTAVFHHVQETKIELSIQLDNLVDVTDPQEYLEKRRKLLKDLTVLLKMEPSMNSEELEVSFDFLVKVNENRLELQHEVLQRLLYKYVEEEVPIAIISVIGQPKSRKTVLTNYIQSYIISKASSTDFNPITPTPGFPSRMDKIESHPIWERLKGQDGILVWTKPHLIKHEDGTSLAVIMLDIWSSNSSNRIYTKLVDFCIGTSSAVILSEDSTISADLLWNPSQSCVSYVRLTQRKLQNLFIIIYGDWKKHSIYVSGFEGGEYIMNCKTKRSPALSRIIDTGKLLGEFFMSSNYYLLPLKNDCPLSDAETFLSFDQEHIHNLHEFTTAFLSGSCELRPIVRNDIIYTSFNVSSLMEQVIIISNDITQHSNSHINPQKEIVEGHHNAAVNETGQPVLPENTNIVMNPMERLPVVTKAVSDPVPVKINSERAEAGMEGVEPVQEILTSKVHHCEDCPQINARHENIVEGKNYVGINEARGRLSQEGAGVEMAPIGIPVVSTVVQNPVPVSSYSGSAEGTINKAGPIQAITISKVSPVKLMEMEQCAANKNTVEINSQEEVVKDSCNVKVSRTRRSDSHERISGVTEPVDNIYVASTEVQDSVPSKNDKGSAEDEVMDEDESTENSVPVKNERGSLEEAMDGAETIENVNVENSVPVKSYGGSAEEDGNVPVAAMVVEDLDLLNNESGSAEEPMDDFELIDNDAVMISEVEQFEQINGEELAAMYRKAMRDCFDNLSGTDFFFKREDLQSEHMRLKNEVEKSFVAKYPNVLINNNLSEKMQSIFDGVFVSFEQENSQNQSCYCVNAEKVKQNVNLKIGEVVTKLHSLIQNNPLSFSCGLVKNDLKTYYEPFTQDLPEKFKNYFDAWYLCKSEEFVKSIDFMATMIKAYRDSMENAMTESIYLTKDEFDEAHKIYHKTAEEMGVSHKWSPIYLKELAMWSIDLIMNKLFHRNMNILKLEDKMAMQAIDFAENAYHEFMVAQISSAAVADSQVTTFHEIGVKAVEEAYLSGSGSTFTYTKIWSAHCSTLKNRLQPHLAAYVKENRRNLDKAEKHKKSVMKNCEEAYVNSMNKFILSKKVSDQKLGYYHVQSKNEAVSVLNEKISCSKEKEKIQKSWTKELLDKLIVLRTMFIEENNRKSEVPIKNVPAAAAAAVNYKASEKSSIPNPDFGVGVYFGSDLVTLGIYNNSQTELHYLKSFSPYVTFARGGIVFFNQIETHFDHFNVCQILETVENYPRTVFASGQCFQLMSEEIAAIFLNKIKSEAENTFGQELKSCVVAVSAYMSTSAKHQLKSALSIAGFERSKIIHSTTAIGLSYILRTNPISTIPVAFIHEHASTFDVAVAVVSSKSVTIKSIGGLPPSGNFSGAGSSHWFGGFFGRNENMDPLSLKKKLLNTTFLASTLFQIQMLVMVGGEQNVSTFRKLLHDPPCMKMNEVEGIVFGAAAYDASQNGNTCVSFLEYVEVFPYTLTANFNRKHSQKIVTQNTPIIPKNRQMHFTVDSMSRWDKLTLNEYVGKKGKCLTFVAGYSIEVERTKCSNFVFFANITGEGLIEMECKSALGMKVVPVKITGKFMSPEQQRAAEDKLRSVLIQPSIDAVRLCDIPVPVKSTPVVEDTSVVAKVEENLPSVDVPEDAKVKLTNLIKEVQSRLEKSTGTNRMIVDRINVLITRCKEVLTKSDVKEKQLQIEIKTLEIAAAKIKP